LQSAVKQFFKLFP